MFVSTHLWFKSGKNHRTFFALLVDQMFGAMSKPMTNITWNQLCTKVKKIFSSDSVDVDEVIKLMTLYKSNNNDWAQYSLWDINVK